MLGELNIVNIRTNEYCMDVIEDTGRYNVLSYTEDLNDIICVYDNEENKHIFVESLFNFYEKVKPASKLRFNNEIEYQVFLDAKFGVGEFFVIGPYKNTNTPCKIRHKCGYVYATAPKYLIDERRIESKCKFCRSLEQISRGEKIITNVLKNHNIPYDFQYVFEDCRDKKPLPFDFAVYTDSTKSTIKAIVEFDGEQHFKSVEAWGGDEKLLYTKRHDAIKDFYCFHNNIPLLRIPFIAIKYIEPILLDFLENPIVFEQPLDSRDLFKYLH